MAREPVMFFLLVSVWLICLVAALSAVAAGVFVVVTCHPVGSPIRAADGLVREPVAMRGPCP